MAADAPSAVTTAAEAAPPRRAQARPEAGPPPAIGLDALTRESALTYLVDARNFKALQSEPRLGAPARLAGSRETREYFDTELGDLARCGLALSLRHARGRARMTLHDGGAQAVFSRADAETPVEGAAPRPELFPAALARLVAEATEGRPLRALFRTEARRAARAADFEGATFEVVFRQGEIVAGRAREELREIEISLKAGAPAALYRFGLALAECGLTRLAAEPLAGRGRRLAWGTPPALARAGAPDFGPDAALDEAIGALLRNGLTQFLGNWPAMQGAEVGEAVHQIRVSLRRLRSALGLLRPTFASAELESLRAQAKAIADRFGDARDWDVFADMVEAGPKAALPELPGFAALIERATVETADGRARALQTLAGPETARFVLSLQAFIVARGWRNAVADDEVERLAAPAVVFASQALDALYRRVRKRGRGFETLAPEPRHRLRIALKQLRYACEFFSPLYAAPGRVRAFARAASELQDILGLANDVAVAEHLIARLDLKSDPSLGFAAGAVVGWCGRSAHLDARTLHKAWKTFRKAAPFWRDGEEEAAG
jgi:inorganic triphosphatase YgiF